MEMKIMKRFLLLTIIVCGSVTLFGQTNLLLNEPLSFGMKDYWGYMNKKYGGVSMGFSYNIVNFPNAAEKNLIKEKWSWSYGIRGTSFPFIYDYSMFYGKFNVNNAYQIPLLDKYDELTINGGWQLSLSVCPLPYIGYGFNKLTKKSAPNLYRRRLSDTFVPYIGLGYQWSKLAVTGQEDYKSNLKLSSMQWKTGCNIYIDRLPFDLVVEYMQTLHKNKERRYTFLSFGIHVRFNRLVQKASKIYID